MKNKLALLSICLFAIAPLASVQTVEEKRRLASSAHAGQQDGEALKRLNQDLAGERKQLEMLSGQVAELFLRKAPE